MPERKGRRRSPLPAPAFFVDRHHDKTPALSRLGRCVVVRPRSRRARHRLQQGTGVWARHAGCEPGQLVERFSTREEFYHRHETGEISDAEFFGALRASLGIGISDAQFLEGWNAIFAGEMPGIVPLLERAAQRLPLYAFSNTNSAHVDHFSVTYAGVLGHFREIFPSSSIGLRKPNAAAYDHVVEAIGVPASRIVFFDDSADNIEGARARGLIAVHVTTPGDVGEALAALGI